MVLCDVRIIIHSLMHRNNSKCSSFGLHNNIKFFERRFFSRKSKTKEERLIVIKRILRGKQVTFHIIQWEIWEITEWKNGDHKKYINWKGIFDSASHNFLFCPHPDSDIFSLLFSTLTCIFSLTESKNYFWTHVCSWPLSCPSGQESIKLSNMKIQLVQVFSMSVLVLGDSGFKQLLSACFLLIPTTSYFCFVNRILESSVIHFLNFFLKLILWDG